MIASTRPEMSVNETTLYVAFELGKREWKLAMTSGFGADALLRTVASGESARSGACAARRSAAIRVGGRRAGGELLRSGARRVSGFIGH